MKKKYYIKNYRPKMPLFATLLVFMMFDYYTVPSWAQGGAWTLIGIVWIVTIVNLFTYKGIDLLDDTDQSEKTRKVRSNFQKRLEEIQAKSNGKEVR